MKARVGLAVVVACELLVAGAGVRVVGRPPARASAPAVSSVTSAPVAATTTTAAPPTPLETEIAALSAQVARIRGLPFVHPVKVRPASAEEMQATVLAAARTDAATQAVELTLGYLDPAADPNVPTPGALWGASRVRVHYDIARDELVANVALDGHNPPSLRALLVSGLALALDDQQFNLDRMLVSNGVDETDVTLSTLAGGDSQRVERQFVDELSVRERDEMAAFDRQAERDARTRPPLTWHGELGPATSSDTASMEGVYWVDRLLAGGKQAALDAAFRSPPATSAELFHPPSDPLQLVEVATPAAEGEVIAQGPMGWDALAEFQAAQWGAFPWDYYKWVGGRYVAWKSGGETCVRFTFRAKDGLSAALLGVSFQLDAEYHGRSTVVAPRLPRQTSEGVYPPVANDVVTYTTCGLPATRDQATAGKIRDAFIQRFDQSIKPR